MNLQRFGDITAVLFHIIEKVYSAVFLSKYLLILYWIGYLNVASLQTWLFYSFICLSVICFELLIVLTSPEDKKEKLFYKKGLGKHFNYRDSESLPSPVYKMKEASKSIFWIIARID